MNLGLMVKDYVYVCEAHRGGYFCPDRLVAQDRWFSSIKPGFNSPSGRLKKTLSSRFFKKSTLTVAKELLGKFLIRRLPPTADRRRSGKSRTNADKLLAGMITEVEAYVGLHDRASHASRGRTKRNGVMFGKPGYWYVYLIYGLHHCLNIVTEREGFPAAVLIRSVRLLPDRYDRSGMVVSGPGRVCGYFRVDKRLNKRPAALETGLWIEDRRVKIGLRQVKRGKRIGVDYAGLWKHKRWRFYLE